MLDEGVWAEIIIADEHHLGGFAERSAQGVHASVYNVRTKQWIAFGVRGRYRCGQR